MLWDICNCVLNANPLYTAPTLAERAKEYLSELEKQTNQPMTYLIIPDTHDGSTLPTQPEPLPLCHVSGHIKDWLKRYELQGYYRNCRYEAIPLNEIAFRIEPRPLRPLSSDLSPS